jgi:hypothetical protein
MADVSVTYAGSSWARARQIAEALRAPVVGANPAKKD